MLKTKDKWTLFLRLSIVATGSFSLFYYFATSRFLNIIAYFTVQSNLFVLFYFSAALIYTYRVAKQGSIEWDYRPQLKGFVTLMITITGVVFAVILAPILATSTPEQLGDFGVNQTPLRTFCSFLLHYYIPTAVLLDWFLFSKKGVYSFKTTFPWFIYPLSYIAMVYLRAPFISDLNEKYIYPFLNPDTMKGWLIPFILFLWLFFAGVAYLFVYLDQYLARKRNPL